MLERIRTCSSCGVSFWTKFRLAMFCPDCSDERRKKVFTERTEIGNDRVDPEFLQKQLVHMLASAG